MPIERAIPGGPEWDALGARHLVRYLFAADLARDGRVLDAGTGAGYGAALLRSLGAAQVIAVDIDPPAIAAAQKAFPLPGLTFLVDDCETLSQVSSTTKFDLITNFENLEHLPHPEKFLAAAARLLTPEGALLISTPDRANTSPFKNNRPANPFHRFEWYRDEFHALLSPHFAQIDMRVQVQSYALTSRQTAVRSLRQAITWSNPVTAWLFRKFARTPTHARSWKALESLAAPAPSDYPIVTWETASIHGTSFSHFAICRQSKTV